MAHRVIILLLACGGVAAAMAGVRIEQVRCAARLQQLKLERIDVERQLALQRAELARLRDPARILDKVASPPATSRPRGLAVDDDATLVMAEPNE